MRTPTLAALELRRFGRGRLPRAAMVAVLLLPLLYGALYLWSFWDPYGRLDKLPVALVNADKGTAGDTIVQGLKDSDTFDWQRTSAAEAAKGVEDGTYYLSLTVPADFTDRVTSSGGEDPVTAALKVRTNDANNYIVGQISRTVFSEVRSTVSTKASRKFYDKIYVSFSDLHDRTTKAADGADDVTTGAGNAEDGSATLGEGIDTAKDGADQLAGGLKKTKTGAHSLASGLGTLSTGAGKVATGASQVADGTQILADKVNGASDEIAFVKKHAKEINAAARLVATGSQAIRDGLGELPANTAEAVAQAHSAAAQLRSTYNSRCPLGAVTSECKALKKAADTADDVAALAVQLQTYVRNGTTDIAALRDDLGTVHSIAQQLATADLPKELDTVVTKVNALNTGAHHVATGAGKVSTGLGTASTGANSLDTGIGKLSTGANDLAGGMYKLSDGANRLTTGLTELTDGSGQLATGLHQGASKIPDYGTQTRDARTKVMSDPVQLASQNLHKAANYGTGFAPYFIPLSLWVGAMVAYMLLQPLSKRALATGAPAWRIAIAGWLPVVAIGIAQTLALLAVLHWAIGLQMVRAAGTIGFLLLVTACFAAIVQWLNARFGPAGRVLVLALLMLQLTSAGGTYPVQTSPGFFNALHPLLPMTYVVDGLRHLITGGELWPVWRACLVLGVFTAGALTLTAWSARRKQVWTLDRLHPELSL
ncbi:MAG: putative rane protein [Streptomyces sp.]|nr:putative rane protein [Streptomyces sp.]